jgi:hypothetical protein
MRGPEIRQSRTRAGEDTKRMCSACRSDHEIRMVDEYVGFCCDCRDRLHVHADDELGGEA